MQRRAPSIMWLGPSAPDFPIPRGWKVVANTLPETNNLVASVVWLKKPVENDCLPLGDLAKVLLQGHTPANLRVLRRVMRRQKEIPDSWGAEFLVFAGTLLEDQGGKRYVARLATVASLDRCYRIEWVPLETSVPYDQGFAVVMSVATYDLLQYARRWETSRWSRI